MSGRLKETVRAGAQSTCPHAKPDGRTALLPPLNAEAAPSRIVLPVLLFCDALPKPHGGNPLASLPERAAGVLGVATVHLRTHLCAVVHIPKEEICQRPEKYPSRFPDKEERYHIDW